MDRSDSQTPWLPTGGWMDRSNPEAPPSVAMAALVVEGGLVLIALGLGWLVGQSPWSQIDWSPADCGIGLAAAVPMLLGLLLIDRFPIGPFEKLQRVMRHSILPLFRQASLGELLLISVLAGLGEELLFRGVIQGLGTRLTGSPALGLAIASLLFGLAHPITRTYAVVATLIGLYFGWLYLATGNLLVPVVAHAAYDFVALVYLLRQPGRRAWEDSGGEWLP